MTRDEQAKLDDLLDVEEGLTKWELDFITELRRREPISRSTSKKLDEVWSERVGERPTCNLVEDST